MADAHFVIDGREYEIPGIDTFDMDDAVLLYEYSGITLEDFAPVDPDDPDREELEDARAKRLKHPGILKTLLHVAYARGNPKLSKREVSRLVSEVKILEAITDGEEDEESPPAEEPSTSAPSASSPNGSHDSSSSSGLDSLNTSIEPDEILASTGATR